MASAATDFRPIYAIFEGGGAKGITHIGALKALELEKRTIVGVAGSSAGAIIAALVAVGYTADEIFAPDGSEDLLSRRGLRPIDLLGPGSWRRYRLVRVAAVPLVVLLLGGLVGTAAMLGTGQGPTVVAAGIAAVAALLLWLLLRPIVRARALFTSDTMRRTLDAILRDKLNTYLPPGRAMGAAVRVRFRDIDPANLRHCARLKVVVSDARSGQLKLFDHVEGNVVVADAVAASAAIPFVFPPGQVEGAALDSSPIYVDGGLVSNLPAWSFLREKKMFEREQGGAPIPTVAFSLSAATPASPPPTGSKPVAPGIGYLLGSVIRTGIFGSQRVVQDFIADLITIDLPSPLGTLDFDCSREVALAAYQSGLNAARATIARLDLIAAVTTRVLEELLMWVTAHVAGMREAERPTGLRMCLIDPVDDLGTAFRIVASVGMADDPDDRLELDGRNALAPRAFATRGPVYGQIRGRAAGDLMMTKYERALVCQTVDSAICVPIWPPGGKSLVPERVLCLDSREPLESLFRDQVFMSELGRRSVLASRTLIES